MKSKELLIKRISKIFALFAVLIAAGLCMLLLDCGNKPSNNVNADDPSNQIGNTDINIDDEKTNNDNIDNVDDDKKNNNDNIVPGDIIAVESPTYGISSIFESEYDLNNLQIPISYAVSRDGYPFDRDNNGLEFKKDNIFIVYDYEICFFANKTHEYIADTQENFKILDETDPGEINGDFYMIEKISFPKKNENKLADMEAMRNKIASDFGYYYDRNNEYWTYDHNIIATLPREYLDNSGTLYFNLKFLIKCYDIPENLKSSMNLSWIEGHSEVSPHFDYTVDGDKVKLTEINNGAHKLKPYDSIEETVNKSSFIVKSKSAKRETTEIDASDNNLEEISQNSNGVS